MKTLSTLLLGLALLVLASPALAAKPDPKAIRHCGCVYDSLEGTSMLFHDIVVAGKSKGHRNHVASAVDYNLCFAGLDAEELPTYEMWVRDRGDCLLSGTDDDIPACTDEEEFGPCGSPYTPEP